MTSPAILACINQSLSFAFVLLTPQDNLLLLKADIGDGDWYNGLKIKWSTRKTYNMHLSKAQLLHNYFQEGVNIGVKHNSVVFVAQGIFFCEHG